MATRDRRSQSWLLLIALAVVIPGRVVAQTPQNDLFAQVFGAGAVQELSAPVIWRGRIIGEVPLRSQGAIVLVDPQALSALLRTDLRDETVERLLRLPTTADGKVEIGELAPLGLGLFFDTERVELRVSPQAEQLRLRPLGAIEGPRIVNPLVPAPLSAYMNGWVAGVYQVRAQTPLFRGSVTLEPVVQYRGWVGETQLLVRTATVDEETNTTAEVLEVVGARVVRDLVPQQIRLAAGIVGHPGLALASTSSLYGVGLQRSDELDESRPFQQRGEAEFIVREDGPVSVFLNGRPYRNFQLNAGTYRLENVPFGRGRNELAIRQEYGDGSSDLLYQETVYFDAALVAVGRHLYSGSLGVFRADPTVPVLAARYLYGLLPRLSVGAVGVFSTRRSALALRSQSAAGWGTTALELGGSYSVVPDRFGVAMAFDHTVAFQTVEYPPSFQLRLQVAGPGFAVPLPNDVGSDSAAWIAIGLGYNQRLPESIGFSAGVEHRRWFGDDEARTRLRFSLSKQFGREVSLTAQVMPQFGSGVGDVNGGLYLRVVPRGAAVQIAQSTDFRDNSATVSVSPQETTGALSWNASTVLFGDVPGLPRQRLSGGVTYNGQFLTGDVQQILSATPNLDRLDSRTAVQLATAIAYADGAVAVSAPIRDAFVILVPRESIRGHTVNILSGGIAPVARLRQFPVAVADIRAYRPAILALDGSALPDGLSVGRETVAAVLGYRQGARLVVGGAAQVYVTGLLVNEDLEPLALEAGEVVDTEGTVSMFFTDRRGHFEIYDLRSGEYRLYLFRFPESQSIFAVPDDALGKFELDEVLLITRDE